MCSLHRTRSRRGSNETKLLVAALLLSLAANVLLCGLLLDAGLTLDGAEVQAEVLRNRRREALLIIGHGWIGRRAIALDELARALEGKGVLVGRDGGTREIGDYFFDVEEGIVTGVRDLSSPRDRTVAGGAGEHDRSNTPEAPSNDGIEDQAIGPQ